MRIPLDISYIDLTLTRISAKEEGYVYVGDVIYDVTRLTEALRDILHLVQEEGYKLGNPGDDTQVDPYFGLYRPVKVGQRMAA